ncbi:hypothetical protein B0H14DRAFT_3489929 [Mycena olivaceomarginata]|nr:hypothetical protein B0H14DRAFT_3489929 [Mycena olivaceomarginata]
MPSEIVENIAYLSNYLEESHARVRELEKELANVRLEAETMLEEMRKKANETQDGQETSTELRAAHDALAAGAERYVLLKTKYNKVKEDKTSLRGALAEKDAQIHSLGQKNSRIQAEYEAEEKEKAQLQQALRELLETAEGLRNEGKESIDQKKNGGGTASLNVSIAHKFIDQKKNGGGDIRGEVTSDITSLFL